MIARNVTSEQIKQAAQEVGVRATSGQDRSYPLETRPDRKSSTGQAVRFVLKTGEPVDRWPAILEELRGFNPGTLLWHAERYDSARLFLEVIEAAKDNPGTEGGLTRAMVSHRIRKAYRAGEDDGADPGTIPCAPAEASDLLRRAYEVARKPRAPKFQRVSRYARRAGRPSVVPGAMCWHGHRDFFRALYRIAPDAWIRTGLATYTSAEQFEATFRDTKQGGTIQAGLQYRPYEQACTCGPEVRS